MEKRERAGKSNIQLCRLSERATNYREQQNDRKLKVIIEFRVALELRKNSYLRIFFFFIYNLSVTISLPQIKYIMLLLCIKTLNFRLFFLKFG